MCRALYGRVDWNITFSPYPQKYVCRALYGRVDWNFPLALQPPQSVPSRSLRARGLKRSNHKPSFPPSKVALFTGAWIETNNPYYFRSQLLCRALYGRVDWNSSDCMSQKPTESRALYGRVDWNTINNTDYLRVGCRALYGRVDWNILLNTSENRIIKSRSLRARGLKQCSWRVWRGNYCVALFTGAWIETSIYILFFNKILCRALYGRVDWNAYK